jgi:hypothetical protein
VRTLADLQGLQLRVLQSELMDKMVKALRAQPMNYGIRTHVEGGGLMFYGPNFPELFPALRRHSRDQGFALFIWGRRRRVLQKSPNVLENCERYTLRSLVRRSAKRHGEVTVDHRCLLIGSASASGNSPGNKNISCRTRCTNNHNACFFRCNRR